MSLSPETLEIPKIEVVCAVIRDGDSYLACQRSEIMREPLHWEFPGGKVELGESLIQALHREVWEELAATVTVRGILRPSVSKHSDKVIRLHPFLCIWNVNASFALNEHANFRWVTAKEFEELLWCPADLDILERLQDGHIELTRWWQH